MRGPLLLVFILAAVVVGSWLFTLLWKMPTDAIVQRVPFLRERMSLHGEIPQIPLTDYESIKEFTEAINRPTASEIVGGIFWIVLVGAWLLFWVALAISQLTGWF